MIFWYNDLWFDSNEGIETTVQLTICYGEIEGIQKPTEVVTTVQMTICSNYFHKPDQAAQVLTTVQTTAWFKQ